MRRMTAIATIVIVALLAAQPALAAPAVANSAFMRLWERQDRPVAEQVSGRSWSWGPAPISDGLRETLVDVEEGTRLVQYFDKSRMEINDPAGDPTSAWYVTNGLLPIELMTGRMQIGFNRFEFHGPARVSAIGDPGNFPTYADLLPLYQSPGALNPADLEKPATAFLNADGTLGTFKDSAGDTATVLVAGANNHAVARAFADFMAQRGLLYVDGRYIRDQVYDPLFVFGLPVSEPYWVKAKVGGVERPILFQVFERRVLTYNPANPAAFRVEMGNVGQHYYQWRYPK